MIKITQKVANLGSLQALLYAHLSIIIMITCEKSACYPPVKF